jgi:cell fate regulator YaaT (PSP1 superfamily)
VEHLIEVAFKGNRREFFRWAFEAPPPEKAAIIVEVERGEDFGRVHATGDLAERRKAGTTHGKEQREPYKAALRLASADDIARASALRADDETARRFAVQKARALNLQMKISDAEWQWDRRRLTFYFTAEERVDFRALVRQLEGHFGVRVQMWHIGPRDEAKRLDGVGHCGRQLCSAAWLPELLPVKTSLAKEQRLSTITPTQISGACGRLMCCLRYEHEFYVQARKRFPKQGKIVQTLEGEERVDATDIFRDLVTLRNPAGDVRTISLAQFKRELAGEAMPVDDEPHDAEQESEHEEFLDRANTVPLRRAEPPRKPRVDTPDAGRAPSRPSPRDGSRDRRPSPRPDAQPSRRPDNRQDPRPDARPSPRAELPRDREQPTVTPPPSATPAVAAQKPGPVNDQAAHVAPPGSTDGDERRGRRRRGRRGGRRHRGDRPSNGQNGGQNDGDASSSNSDD